MKPIDNLIKSEKKVSEDLKKIRKSTKKLIKIFDKALRRLDEY